MNPSSLNSKNFILLCVFVFTNLMTWSQNAPVTRVGNVLHHGPVLTVPVKITNFTDIGAVSLTLDYASSIVTVAGITVNPALPGFMADWTTNPGRIVMSWIGLMGVTLPDNDHLVDITFSNLNGGTTPLTWFDNGVSCEYAKFDNGAFNSLPDTPSASFYQNGSITWQRPAPKAIVPSFTSLPNQPICFPVIVNQFTDIGSISLTLDYDPSIMTFTGFNTFANPAWNFDVQATTPGRMIAGGYGPGFSLPDSSTLFYACFNYLGGTSNLTWYDANGVSCEFADAETLDPLWDTPLPDFYVNGLVSTPLVADFLADNSTPPINTTIQISDLSNGDPESHDWSFVPPTIQYMNNTDCHSKHPQVKFTDGGAYTVTLVVHKACFKDTKVKVSYITAGIGGRWTGETSADWTERSNWDNHFIPDNTTDVLIPGSCVNWPLFTGDLIIGTHCKSITLGDPNAQMTITGDLIINN